MKIIKNSDVVGSRIKLLLQFLQVRPANGRQCPTLFSKIVADRNHCQLLTPCRVSLVLLKIGKWSCQNPQFLFLCKRPAGAQIHPRLCKSQQAQSHCIIEPELLRLPQTRTTPIPVPKLLPPVLQAGCSLLDHSKWTCLILPSLRWTSHSCYNFVLITCTMVSRRAPVYISDSDIKKIFCKRVNASFKEISKA